MRWYVLLLASLSIVVIYITPESFIVFLDLIHIKIFLFFTVLLLLTTASFVIYWFFSRPPPSKVMLAITRFFLTAGSIAIGGFTFGIPNFEKITFSTETIETTFQKTDSGATITIISILVLIIVSGFMYHIIDEREKLNKHE